MNDNHDISPRNKSILLNVNLGDFDNTKIEGKDETSCITNNHITPLQTIYQFIDKTTDTTYPTKDQAQKILSIDADSVSETERILCHFSHDLKNLLNPVISLLPLLEKQEIDSDKLQKIQVIHRNIINIDNLANRTIELIKAKSCEYEPKISFVNVTDVINNIVKQHAKKTEENQCTISNFITKPLMICGDQAYLERIFFHIIDNAIRYTPDHGSITINAQSTPHEITIAINDTGIGMTPHQLQNAFLEFYKGDTSRHSLDSNGLGLAICKYLVEKHDGKIWAESDGVGKGSTIFLTLPDLKKI